MSLPVQSSTAAPNTCSANLKSDGLFDVISWIDFTLFAMLMCIKAWVNERGCNGEYENILILVSWKIAMFYVSFQ